MDYIKEIRKDIGNKKIILNSAGVVIVKDNKIIEKKKLELPEKLINVCKCNNPRCITSIERGLDQIFNLTDKKNHTYRCHYCEATLEKDQFL